MINSFILRNGRSGIARLCSILRMVLVVFLVVEMLYFILSWGGNGNYHLGFMRVELRPDGMSVAELMSLKMGERLLGITLGLPALGMLSYAVLQFNSILQSIKEGRIFAMQTIALMQSFLGSLLLYMVCVNLEKPLRAVIINAVFESKILRISFSLSANELLLVLVCALFYVLSAIMHEGRRLEEENEGFV